MIAAELNRSLRGATALIGRDRDVLRHFDVSADGFWRSFGAIGLTIPAFVVELALVRHGAEVEPLGSSLLDRPGLALAAALAHVLSFLALPLATLVLARRFGLGAGFVPFVVVTNWLGVLASFPLAVPGTLFLLGLETAALAVLFTAAFTAVVATLQWRAARLILGTGPVEAGTVIGLGLALSVLSGSLAQALAAISG